MQLRNTTLTRFGSHNTLWSMLLIVWTSSFPFSTRMPCSLTYLAKERLTFVFYHLFNQISLAIFDHNELSQIVCNITSINILAYDTLSFFAVHSSINFGSPITLAILLRLFASHMYNGSWGNFTQIYPSRKLRIKVEKVVQIYLIWAIIDLLNFSTQIHSNFSASFLLSSSSYHLSIGSSSSTSKVRVFIVSSHLLL